MKTNNKKIEDKFYGKRVVKGIFAKAKFNFRDVGDAHQKAIAIKTLKNPSLALLGGPTAEEAESILRKKFKYTDKQIAELKKYEGSRTGSKAKFAVVGSKGNKTAIVIRNGGYEDNNDWIAYVVQHTRGQEDEVLGGMRHYSTEARAKAAALRGLETSGLRASRQGSKTKFANGVYGNEEIAKGLSQVLKSMGFDTMASDILKGPKDNETLRRYIRVLKSKSSLMSQNERGMFLLQTLEKQLASRTGAKAKFDFKPPANWVFNTMVSYARHYQDLGGYKGDAIYERAIDMAQKILSMPDFQRKGKSAHAVARHIIKNEGALKMNLARTGAKVFK